jgi:hypothetical protein
MNSSSVRLGIPVFYIVRIVQSSVNVVALPALEARDSDRCLAVTDGWRLELLTNARVVRVSGQMAPNRHVWELG